MLVVDIMHEVDLGIWKALFIQLLHLLEATDKGLLNALDIRQVRLEVFLCFLPDRYPDTVVCQRLEQTQFVVSQTMSAK